MSRLASGNGAGTSFRSRTTFQKGHLPMPPIHRLLRSAVLPIVLALVSFAPSAPAIAAPCAPVQPAVCLFFTTQTVTGMVGRPHYDENGFIDSFPVTANGVTTTITVQSPDANKTHAIEKNVGLNSKVEYHDSGTPAAHIYEGIGPP